MGRRVLSSSLMCFGITFTTEAATAGAAQFGTWVQGPNIPQSGYFAAACGAVLNGKFYVVGGRTRQTNTGRNVYCYDPATNAWTTKALLPYANGTSAEGLIAHGGYLYCMGGTMATDDNWWGQPIVNAYRYDPTTDSWTTLPSMPQRRSDFGIDVLNDKIYCFGGANWWPNTTAIVNVYDPNTNTWSTATSLPVGRALSGCRGSYNGGYVSPCGLSDAWTMNTNTYYYSPVSNSWTQMSVCQDTKAADGRFLFSTQDGMYFAGPKAGTTDQTWVSLYHPETGVLEYVNKAPAARTAGIYGYDPVSKTIYAVAGTQGSNYVQTLEYVSVRRYTLTLSVAGDNKGHVDVEPNLPSYEPNTLVTLTAYPDSGRSWAGWQGDVDPNLSFLNPITIKMDADKTISTGFNCGVGVGAMLPLMGMCLVVMVAMRRR